MKKQEAKYVLSVQCRVRV